MAKICPECGGYVNEVAKVCYTCGAKLERPHDEIIQDISPSMDSAEILSPSMDSVQSFDSVIYKAQEHEKSMTDYSAESGFVPPPDFKFVNPAAQHDDDRKPIFLMLFGVVFAIIIAIIMLFTMEPKDNNKKNDDIPAGNSVTTSANAGSNNSKLYSKLAEPVQDFYDGLKLGDYDMVMNTYPPSIKKAIIAESETYGISKSQYIQNILDDYAAEGVDLKNSIVIIDVDSAEAYAASEVDELESSFAEYYDVDLDIKEAYYINVTITVLNGGQSEKFTNTCVITKVSGKWYYLD